MKKRRYSKGSLVLVFAVFTALAVLIALSGSWIFALGSIVGMFFGVHFLKFCREYESRWIFLFSVPVLCGTNLRWCIRAAGVLNDSIVGIVIYTICLVMVTLGTESIILVFISRIIWKRQKEKSVMYEELFEKVKEEVWRNENLSDISYATWIKPLRFHSIENGVFYIAVPLEQEHCAKYISSKYQCMFEDALEAHDIMCIVDFVCE